MQSFALMLLGCPGMALLSSDVPLSRSCSGIPHQCCSTARLEHRNLLGMGLELSQACGIIQEVLEL